MCVWAAAAASLAVGAAQAIGKYSAQQQDAAAQQQQQTQDRYAAELDRNLQWNQLNMRQQQEQEAASQALFDNEIRAEKVRGTADTQAAGAGVSGNSVEAMARDVYMQQGRIDSSTIRNEQMNIEQEQMQKDAAGNQYLSRTDYSPIKQASITDLGLGIAGAAANAYGTYYKIRTGQPDKK